MSGIDRLHPHLQHAIVHDLGWRSLRPVQELTIDAVLDGCNAVVPAPTAGGKTEAAVFPLLSRILSEGLQPVSILYVCPIRALLNNQEERLTSYARMVGLEVFKWHGDVSDARKQRFRDAPAHILMTTPESLEVMMISERTDARALFRGLSAVVIDEVHAFAGDDRGAHLAALLERLGAFCGRDIQRIGLSATVGNPLVIGEWLQGSSRRPFRLVDPPRPPAERQLRVEHCEDIGHAALGIAQIARGKKSLVFVESRSKAERVAQALGGSGVEVFIHHSSVSRADRALAEEQFARGQNTAIVCTSTMELGIDDSDTDDAVADSGWYVPHTSSRPPEPPQGPRTYEYEREMYPDLRAGLETWAREHRLKDNLFRVRDTADQGSKKTGKWSRPDAVVIGIKHFPLINQDILEVITFEAKLPSNLDIRGIHEASAHRRFSTHSYAFFHVTEEQYQDDERREMMKEEAMRVGVGLIFATAVQDFDTWDELVKARAHQPEWELLENFVGDQLGGREVIGALWAQLESKAT